MLTYQYDPIREASHAQQVIQLAAQMQQQREAQAAADERARRARETADIAERRRAMEFQSNMAFNEAKEASATDLALRAFGLKTAAALEDKRQFNAKNAPIEPVDMPSQTPAQRLPATVPSPGSLGASAEPTPVFDASAGVPAINETPLPTASTLPALPSSGVEIIPGVPAASAPTDLPLIPETIPQVAKPRRTPAEMLPDVNAEVTQYRNALAAQGVPREAALKDIADFTAKLLEERRKGKQGKDSKVEWLPDGTAIIGGRPFEYDAKGKLHPIVADKAVRVQSNFQDDTGTTYTQMSDGSWLHDIEPPEGAKLSRVGTKSASSPEKTETALLARADSLESNATALAKSIEDKEVAYPWQEGSDFFKMDENGDKQKIDKSGYDADVKKAQELEATKLRVKQLRDSADSLRKRAEGLRSSSPATPVEEDEKVLVQDPSGKKFKLPRTQLEEAIKQGFKAL